MDFLRSLSGKKQSVSLPNANAPTQGGTKSTGVPTELVQKIDAKLALVRHLATCRPFTREGMVMYISLLERSGVNLPSHRKAQMLDANSLMIPEPQADGTTANGYEQLRQSFLITHLEELTEVTRVLGQLPPAPDTLALVKRILEVQRLRR